MAVYLCDNNPHKYTDPGNGDLSEAFEPLTDFLKNTERQARQLPREHCYRINTRIESLVLAGADAFVNDVMTVQPLVLHPH